MRVGQYTHARIGNIVWFIRIDEICWSREEVRSGRYWFSMQYVERRY